MTSKTASIAFTANFESNLAQIEVFWDAQAAPQAYANLLDDLEDTVIGNLERHRRIGRKFFARCAQSIEVRKRVADLQKRFGEAEVREYLSGDYLLLYCVTAKASKGPTNSPDLTIYLLAIRHHRQLTFDFDAFWQANREEDDKASPS